MSAIQPESTGVLRGAVLSGQGNILESINRAAWAKNATRATRAPANMSRQKGILLAIPGPN